MVSTESTRDLSMISTVTQSSIQRVFSGQNMGRRNICQNHSSAQPRWRSSPQEPSRCRRYQTPRRLCYLCWRPQEELRKKRTWRTRWVSGKSQFFAPGNQRCRKIAHNIEDVPLKTTIYSGFLFAMFDDTGEENIYRSPLGDRTVVYHYPSRNLLSFCGLP